MEGAMHAGVCMHNMHACKRIAGSRHPHAATDGGDAKAEATAGRRLPSSRMRARRAQDGAGRQPSSILQPLPQPIRHPIPSILRHPSARSQPSASSAHDDGDVLPSFQFPLLLLPDRQPCPRSASEPAPLGMGREGDEAECGRDLRSLLTLTADSDKMATAIKRPREDEDLPSYLKVRCVLFPCWSARIVVCAALPRTFQRLSGRFWTAGAQVRPRPIGAHARKACGRPWKALWKAWPQGQPAPLLSLSRSLSPPLYSCLPLSHTSPSPHSSQRLPLPSLRRRHFLPCCRLCAPHSVLSALSPLSPLTPLR